MKFDIKNRYDGSVIFECEALNFKMAVELAVKNKAKLGGANLGGANLCGANLGEANLSWTDLGRANLNGANLGRANLCGANLGEANLSWTDLGRANLGGANLGRANLCWTDLVGADLNGANLGGADLGGADLGGANLNGVELDGANLRKANLVGANLRKANLRWADLCGANLCGANLRRADLCGASLWAANLSKIKSDFISVIEKLPSEVPALFEALCDGKIEGSAYVGECACLKGTIAKSKGCSFDDLPKFGITVNSDTPAEKWFLAIQKGDTPENNPVSKITSDWIVEWAETKNIKLPVKKVIWE